MFSRTESRLWLFVVTLLSHVISQRLRTRSGLRRVIWGSTISPWSSRQRFVRNEPSRRNCPSLGMSHEVFMCNVKLKLA
ncbi:hypothetical protein F5B19DRAFT_413164 [Rostrohypoxylon terebratum]|nr:hypothetical protein F5B19DRAFT_413164 [Rostrohypoxylon terebratum]